MGLSDQHPSERWAEDTEVLKAHREATTKDEATGLGPVYIQNKGKSGAQDNPPDFKGKPENPTISLPPRPTQDGNFQRGTHALARSTSNHAPLIPTNPT